MSATPTRKRKYKEDFLQYGFTSVTENDCTKPVCLICEKQFTAEYMKPNKLSRHLEKVHGNYNNKSNTHFKELSDLYHSKFTNNEEGTALKITEVSYRIAYKIAENKKAHIIGEELIKPCIVESAHLLLGEDAAAKMNKIPLSNTTIRGRVKEMSADILSQVIINLQETQFFSLQLDESTDVSNCAQLIAYVRYIGDENIIDEFLFCKSLETTTRGEDIFRVLQNFFTEHNLNWSKLVSICTDGAPSMIGCKSGFTAKVSQIAPHVKFTHCFIHRYALAVKTLPENLKKSLETVVKIINYLKSSATNSRIFQQLCESLGCARTVLLLHTEVRWLSRGRVLHRFLELKEEIKLFFLNKNTSKDKDFTETMNQPTFIENVCYLSDFFDDVNLLNTSLQGNGALLIQSVDKISAFKKKVELYLRLLDAGDTTMFKKLTQNLLASESDGCFFIESIKEHLSAVMLAIDKYYPNLSARASDRWIAQPYQSEETIIEDNDLSAKVEFLALREDLTSREEFQQMSMPCFWINRMTDYPVLSVRALGYLIQFPSTYLCEAALCHFQAW